MKLDIYQFSEDLARFSEQFLVRLLLSSKIVQFTCEIIKSLLLLKALNFDNCVDHNSKTEVCQYRKFSNLTN